MNETVVATALTITAATAAVVMAAVTLGYVGGPTDDPLARHLIAIEDGPGKRPPMVLKAGSPVDQRAANLYDRTGGCFLDNGIMTLLPECRVELRTDGSVWITRSTGEIFAVFRASR